MKIILFDIETTPLISYTWGTYDQNVISVKKDWELLSFAYKELGKSEIVFHSREGEKTDKTLTKQLYRVLNSADVVIAHNGDAFDIKKSFAKFLEHGLKPTSPFVSIDTLKIARQRFRLTSNKLNDLAILLNVGRKIKTPGFDLWLGCMNDDPKAWSLMQRYNRKDVELLEKVYLKLRPWSVKGLLRHSEITCVSCGGARLNKRGFHHTRTASFQIYRCSDCGKYMRGGDKIATKRGGLVGI